MNILITGANFNNKGAQLMLCTLVDTLRSSIPDVKICVSPLLENRIKLQEMKVNILDFPLFHYGNRRYFLLALKFPFIIRNLLRLQGANTNGDIPLNNIDVVMDISGFAFGAKWGNYPLHYLSRFIKRMKKQGSKFFLLPQAFGPFSNLGMEKDIKDVVANVDLLIARDNQSFKFIQDAIATTSKNVIIAPDITLVYKKNTYINDDIFKGDFCAIVPNEQMLVRASPDWQIKYTEVLSHISNIILSKSNVNIVILIHAQAGSKDSEIGKQIMDNISKLKLFSGRIFHFVEEDPIRLKSIIAKSQFLVGSRFHALASALSSNVPCISTSWLHKYEMLFEEYKCQEFNFKEPTENIYEKVESLLNPEIRKMLTAKLKKENAEIENKNKVMWDLILSKIN